MENSIKLFDKQNDHVRIILILAFIFIFAGVSAQMNSLTGQVVEESSKQPVPYATVGLILNTESSHQLITGTISDEKGLFVIDPVKNGKYKLQVSSVGYKLTIKNIEISNTGINDAGIIYLQDTTLLLAETVVVGERIKGKSENDKTIFYINKKILGASGNAPDVLRHIPGIQVDLKQNISLEGNRNILLFVNGIERDRSYISQLNPSLIDRVEIKNTPPSNYDGNISGVINIVLKKDRDMGISGQFFSEIPTSESIVYSFPSYSLHYGFKKLNLYTSYNGEINYEDLNETYNRQIRGTEPMRITSVEQVRQKNISNKFHYGIDYFLTPRDIINYYGSYNPYSYEQDGKVIVETSGAENRTWKRYRDETDANLNIHNSLYYKHLFSQPGREVNIDISNSNNMADNLISYLNAEDAGTAPTTNTEKPEQNSTIIKVDFASPLGSKLLLNTGAKSRIQSMHDETINDFRYNEIVHALYGTLQYKKSKYTINLGLRTEYSVLELEDVFNKSEFSFLPFATIYYKLNAKQNLFLSYNNSINRPSVFQLNPSVYINDPYTIRKGNPLLEPEIRHRLYAEHSIQFHSNYISYRLFYENATNAINNLMFLNDSSVFEMQAQNLGDIHQFGFQFLGSMKIGPLTFNPTVRLYNQSTFVNSLARQYGVENRQNMVFESGFSTILSFRHDFTFSTTFQYTTTKYNIQDNTFCDALYFISLDKTFKNNLKVGIMGALPFAKTFVYQGSKVEAQNFSGSYTGNLKLPAFPIMFRVSYQFHSGKEKTMVERDKEDVVRRRKSGF